MLPKIALFTLIKLLLNTTYRMAYPFLSAFAGGVGVDLAQFSLLFTARSLTGMLGPFLAPIADRRGRKTSMLLGLAVYILGAGAVALWPTYPAFFAALTLTTLGNFIFLPAMQAYLGDHVPYARRGRVIAITELSWSIAFIAGVPLVGLLIGWLGWAAPFGVLALLGLLLLAALAFFLPSEPRPDNGNGAIWHSLGKVMRHRPALAVLLLSFLITAANETVNLVFGVWIEGAFNLQLAALGAASAVIGLSELGGEGLSGWLVDRMGKERAIRTGIMLSALSALVLPLMGGSLVGALAGLFCFYLTFEFTIVSLLPLVSEVLPGARATLMAANVTAFSLGRAAGSLLAPWLFGLGLGANAAAALGLDLLALAVLGMVRLAHHDISVKSDQGIGS